MTNYGLKALTPYASAISVTGSNAPTAGTARVYNAVAGPLAPPLPALPSLVDGD